MAIEIVTLVLMGLCLLAVGVLIFQAVRALRQGPDAYQEYRDHTFTHTFRTEDPFWKMDDKGSHLELVDGQLWYWSNDFDSDDVSS